MTSDSSHDSYIALSSHPLGRIHLLPYLIEIKKMSHHDDLQPADTDTLREDEYSSTKDKPRTLEDQIVAEQMQGWRYHKPKPAGKEKSRSGMAGDDAPVEEAPPEQEGLGMEEKGRTLSGNVDFFDGALEDQDGDDM